MGSNFRYILLSTFIAAILIIVFLQFNSNRSINQLINGNENLLEEFTVKNNLQQLLTSIVVMENTVRGAVIENAAVDSNHIKGEIKNIDYFLEKMDTLKEDVRIAPLIIDLNELVAEKIKYNQNLLNKFTGNGKVAAEKSINTIRSKHLTDSIKAISNKIDELHEQAVKSLIKNADLHGQNAKALGSIMALIAALAAIFTFGYAAIKVREQQRLISKLNISESKAKEAANVKENFLANMSHEIRTPMNAILGYTNLLQRKLLDKESKEYVQTIQKSGENLLTIINDILDLSKIEAGMVRIEESPFSVRGMLHSIEVLFKNKIEEKNLEFNVIIEPTIPDILLGDNVRLTQILVNLISNSIKFTQQGSISIKIAGEKISPETFNLKFEIADTGIGINKEMQQAVFERFQQGESSTTRKFGGTGLGLSIVKDLIAIQNGTISLNSEAGKGATFSFNIPYKISPEQHSVFPPTNTGNSTYLFNSTTKILVVEDNEINQELLKHLFAEWGIHYVMASNGLECLKKVQEDKFDLILMDLQMPDMDGYEATQAIRKQLKLHVPIVAMTAHAMAGEREKCLSYGMNDHLAKPLREKDLISIISNYVNVNSTNKPNKKITDENIFSTINLAYMQEISKGNEEYEKAVTEQFLEMVPVAINLIKQNFEAGNYKAMSEIAHNLKTSISVMGLNEQLNTHLDYIETEQADKNKLREEINYVEAVCTNALQEATTFLQQLA